MARFFKKQGSETIERISEERTGKPNIWWSPEQMTAHGFTECHPDAAALQQAARDAFSFKTFTGRLLQVLAPASTYKLRREISGLREFIVGWKNFDGAKAILDGLKADGTATEEEYNMVLSVLAEQGVTFS